MLTIFGRFKVILELQKMQTYNSEQTREKCSCIRAHMNSIILKSFVKGM